ncbi:hypothetical protein RF11_13628 [Thelohanellus kitauei]|uniref:Uncharacterized protein n=1 Tax=Thelohanellus kitauei TaxID=669202 RepID=A0A0C2M6E1_THEKT|nr:hypothetical protein RF11_13628 [Thelohanellus kitauei]
MKNSFVSRHTSSNNHKLVTKQPRMYFHYPNLPTSSTNVDPARPIAFKLCATISGQGSTQCATLGHYQYSLNDHFEHHKPRSISHIFIYSLFMHRMVFKSVCQRNSSETI